MGRWEWAIKDGFAQTLVEDFRPAGRYEATGGFQLGARSRTYRILPGDVLEVINHIRAGNSELVSVEDRFNITLTKGYLLKQRLEVVPQPRRFPGMDKAPPPILMKRVSNTPSKPKKPPRRPRRPTGVGGIR